MIYLLPSRGKRQYRGKYPTRVHSFSYMRGIAHFELNDCRRYVVTADELAPVTPRYAAEFIANLKPGATAGGTPEMPLNEYAAIVLVGRILSHLRHVGAGRALDTGFSVHCKL